MARYTEKQIFRITQDTFDQIEDWIQASQQTGRGIQMSMNALAMLLAYTNQAFAMRMSAGPVDPQMKNRQAAWKLPVRRITSRYYKGWKVKRLAPGVWLSYNDSREAWFIEFGIHPTGSMRSTDKGNLYVMRVRRPVRKLALKKTLAFVDESRAGERVWEAAFAPFKPGQKYRHRGDLITLDGVQSVNGMRTI